MAKIRFRVCIPKLLGTCSSTLSTIHLLRLVLYLVCAFLFLVFAVMWWKSVFNMLLDKSEQPLLMKSVLLLRGIAKPIVEYILL